MPPVCRLPLPELTVPVRLEVPVPTEPVRFEVLAGRVTVAVPVRLVVPVATEPVRLVVPVLAAVRFPVFTAPGLPVAVRFVEPAPIAVPRLVEPEPVLAEMRDVEFPERIELLDPDPFLPR